MPAARPITTEERTAPVNAQDPLGILALRQDVNRLIKMFEDFASENQQAEYTVAQVAKLWNKSPRTIHRYIADGRIKVVRYGATPMIPREVVSQGVPQSPKP